MKLALLIGNRGFFPSSAITGARDDMRGAAKRAGVDLLEPPLDMTRFGAVESTGDGLKYDAFLRERTGEYDGLIICMPSFSDENGIKAAIRNVRVPILVQAYPMRSARWTLPIAATHFAASWASPACSSKWAFASRPAYRL